MCQRTSHDPQMCDVFPFYARNYRSANSTPVRRRGTILRLSRYSLLITSYGVATASANARRKTELLTAAHADGRPSAS